MKKNTERLRFQLVKLITDGSIQGLSARMRWPGYYDGTPNGVWNTGPEELDRILLDYHQAGFQVHIRWRRKAFQRNGFVSVALDVARWTVGALVQMPGFGSPKLQDQYVVVVVMRDESAGFRRGDVGVHLHRKVQLDLESAGQGADGPDVLLDAVDDNGVAVIEVAADTGDVEAALRRQVVVRSLLVLAPDQSQSGWLQAEQFDKGVDCRRRREQAVEVAGVAASDVAVVVAPDLVEKGLDRQRLEQPGQRQVCVNAR